MEKNDRTTVVEIKNKTTVSIYYEVKIVGSSDSFIFDQVSFRNDPNGRRVYYFTKSRGGRAPYGPNDNVEFRLIYNYQHYVDGYCVINVSSCSVYQPFGILQANKNLAMTHLAEYAYVNLHGDYLLAYFLSHDNIVVDHVSGKQIDPKNNLFAVSWVCDTVLLEKLLKKLRCNIQNATIARELSV